MPEKKMDSKTPISDHISQIMKENEEFFLEHYRDVVDEIVELANDAIDLAGHFAKQYVKEEGFHPEDAIRFYAYHVLTPGSNALLTHLLSGNLPACFRELRFLVESLAKCYLADLKHGDIPFFWSRLHLLHYPNGGNRLPEWRFINEFSKISKKGEEITKLWKDLSEETHMKQFTERVMDNIVNHENVPSYALIIPMNYTLKDLKDLKELNSYVTRFREILNEAISCKNLYKNI